MGSERIEPAFCHIIGQHFRMFEEAKASEHTLALEYACRNWWLAMQSMSILVSTLSGFPHVSIAVSNEKTAVASMIEDAIGYNPMLAEAKRLGWTVKAH